MSAADRPLVSIVIPTRDQARFLPAAIDSVLSQTGTFDVECIVMDGRSRDETPDVLRGYGEAIVWRSEPDHGQADALNKGLRLSHGEIMGWLNSDDVYEPGALQTVVDAFRAADVHWVYGRVRTVDEEGREIRRPITAYKNWRMRRFRYGSLLVENWISQMGVFWRRSAWQQVGDFRTDLYFCMDYDYWLRLGSRWPGIHIPRYLAAFRWYQTSKSGSRFHDQFAEEYQVVCRHAGDDHRFRVFLHRLQVARTVAVYRVMQLLRG